MPTTRDVSYGFSSQGVAENQGYGEVRPPLRRKMTGDRSPRRVWEGIAGQSSGATAIVGATNVAPSFRP